MEKSQRKIKIHDKSINFFEEKNKINITEKKVVFNQNNPFHKSSYSVFDDIKLKTQNF